MTSMLITAGAVALTAALMCGAARATPPPAATVHAASSQPAVNWHYIWQYRYNRWGGRAPGWVAVPNSPR